MSPQRSNLVLSSDIPYVELDILVCDGLDIEADSWNSSNILVELEFVQNGRLSGSIETQHQQSHLLGSEDLAHYLRNLAAHGDGCVRVSAEWLCAHVMYVASLGDAYVVLVTDSKLKDYAPNICGALVRRMR